MHPTCLKYAEMFFNSYLKNIQNPTIVDIGSQNINGSLRDVAPPNSTYVGLDFAEGNGVDIVLKDPYSFSVEDSYADAVVTSSCFEHSQFFWLTFLEALRILKPGGVLYVNAPSNGEYHRYPTDNWRFYPDAGIALNEWANRSGYNSVLMESFIGWQEGDMWNDFVAIFIKDRSFSNNYTDRIYKEIPNATNIHVDNGVDPLKFVAFPQDIRRLRYLSENVAKAFKNLNNI
jgi:SAM-dependent methyltransferase